MSNDLFNTNNGNDLAFQHLLWYLGHPEVWLAFFLWTILLVAIAKIIKKLWTTRKIIWLIIFVLIVGMALAYYAWLLNQALSIYAEGRGTTLGTLRRAKLVFLIASSLSTVWIIIDWLKALQSK